MEKLLSRNLKKIHFIGIGGIGMSGLAYLFLEKGFSVSGSDIKENEIIRSLEKKGAKINIPHSADVIDSQNLVCFSSAIQANNSELKKARFLKIPAVKRGALLGEVLKDNEIIAVSGSHGKTTTTSFIAFVMSKLGKDISSLVGGIPRYAETSSWWGKDSFVVETDESDGSFLEVKPTYSIITNIDKEHLSFYGTFDNLKKAFFDFAESTSHTAIGCGDQEEVLSILKNIKNHSVSYGLGDNNDYRAKNIKFDSFQSSFDLFYKDKFIGSIEIPLLGKHNVQNSLAVLALCLELNFDIAEIKKAMRDFPGTRRRLEPKGRISEVEFVDDYAHHPREIKAVLAALAAVDKKRFVVIFQPHRFSRIKNLFS